MMRHLLFGEADVFGADVVAGGGTQAHRIPVGDDAQARSGELRHRDDDVRFEPFALGHGAADDGVLCTGAAAGEAGTPVEHDGGAVIAELVARGAVVELAGGDGARTAEERPVFGDVFEHLGAAEERRHHLQEPAHEEVHVEDDGGGAIAVGDFLHHAHLAFGADAQASPGGAERHRGDAQVLQFVKVFMREGAFAVVGGGAGLPGAARELAHFIDECELPGCHFHSPVQRWTVAISVGQRPVERSGPGPPRFSCIDRCRWRRVRRVRRSHSPGPSRRLAGCTPHRSLRRSGRAPRLRARRRN